MESTLESTLLPRPIEEKEVGIFLIRHGQTTYNRDGRIRGWVDDIPLDEHGKQSAQAAAEKLQGKDIDCIYCSDLKRAMQTADIIANLVGSKIEITKKLRPWNLGVYQGQKIDDVKPGLAYYSQWPDEKVPKGESFRSFFDRWSSFLRDQMKDSLNEGIAIVGHVRHFLSLEEALAATQGDIYDITGIPTTGGPGPGAVMWVGGGGDLKTLHKGNAEGKGGS